MSSGTLGSILIVVAAATWGFMPLLARLAYAGGASVSTVLLVRFGVAGAAFLPFLLVTGRARALSRHDALELLGLGMAQAGIAALYFTSLRYLPAALAALALYTYPAMAHALAYVFLREPPTARGLAALGLASAGLALSFLPAAAPGAGPGTGRPHALGIALALAAAALWALVLLRAGRVARRVPPLAAAGVVAAGTAAVFLVAGAASGSLDFRLPAGAWVAMGAMGVFSTLLGGAAYFAGLALIPATRAAVLTTVEPVVTGAAAAAFLGEALTPWQIAGGALVVAGAALAAGAPPRGAAQAGAAVTDREG